MRVFGRNCSPLYIFESTKKFKFNTINKQGFSFEQTWIGFMTWKTIYATVFCGTMSIRMLFHNFDKLKENEDTREFQNATFSRIPCIIVGRSTLRKAAQQFHTGMQIHYYNISEYLHLLLPRMRSLVVLKDRRQETWFRNLVKPIHIEISTYIIRPCILFSSLRVW